ncbi:hypothetical protein E3Q16_00155 [Wallemia mellicola]|nr:hypothetical protein E3Q16_00155 [Wallemia mellicola]
MNTNLIKRPKINRACDNCRRKKIRCDGPQTHPEECSNCSISSSASCTYVNPAQQNVASSYVKHLEAKLEEYERLLSEVYPDFKTDYNSSDNIIHRKRKYTPPSSPTGTMSAHINPISPIDYEDVEIADRLGYIFVSNEDRVSNDDQRRYFGRSSARGLIERINIYNGTTPQDILSRKRKIYWRDDWSDEILPHLTKPEYIHEDFGDESLMYELVDLYFTKVNVSMPLLHRERFLADIPKRKLERGFGSVLIMVCALGSQHMRADDLRVLIPGKENILFLPGYRYYGIAKAKMIDPTMSIASLEDIQAFFLLQVYSQNGVYPKGGWIAHTNAMMLSQDIGLHRKSFHGINNERQREARRRTIWCLFIIDVTNAAAFGKTQVLTERDIDMDFPSADRYGDVHPKNRLSVSYLVSLVQLYKLLSQILRSVYRLKENVNGDDIVMNISDIAALNSSLNKWLNELPVDLRIESCSNGDEEVYQLRSYLKIGFYMVQIYIYKSFLPDPRSFELSYFRITSLVICSNASKSIISIQKKLVLDRENINGTCYSDLLLSWSVFNATIVLILSFCESRKNRDINLDDLEYIQLGIEILRKREARVLLCGRALDMLLQVIRTASLPLDPAFMQAQEEHVEKNQRSGNLNEQGDVLFMNLTQFERQGTDFLDDVNLDSILPSLSTGEDWSDVLNAMFNGNK